MSTWGERLGVFDLETTGVDVDTSRIVSACVAVLDENGVPVSRWNWLADPGVEIPEGASAVHGITTERARNEGRDAKIVIAEIVQTLRVLTAAGIPITVYNAPYDLSLLDRECRRHGLEPLVQPRPVIDPLVIDKAVDRYRKGKRTLEVTAQRYDVPLDDAHDAGADAVAAGRVAQALLRRYPDELDIGLAELHDRQQTWHAEQAASFQEYLRSKRGDDSYIADPSWPLKPAADTSSFVDTQPIPALPPRPGLVPILDFSATGVLALDSLRRDSPASGEPDRARFDSEAYRRAPRPSLTQRVETDEQPFITGAEDDSEPAWIVEPTETPMVTLAQSLGSDRNAGPVDAEPEDEAPEDEAPEDVAVEPHDVAPEDEAPEDDEPVVDDEPALGGDSLDVEPMAAADAIGEPEAAPEAPGGPPQAVLRVAAAIVTDPDGRCLLVRKAGTTTFMQAGGKLEPGESALDALARELREELDLELDEATAEYLGVFRADAANEPHTTVSAAVFAFETSAEVRPHGEIEELLWIDDLDGITAELAPLSRDELLPIWAARRSGSTLF